MIEVFGISDIDFHPHTDENYIKHSNAFGLVQARFFKEVEACDKSKPEQWAEEEAFKKVKHNVRLLALNGSKQALSMYLFHEKPQLQDATLVNMAQQIEKKPIKTPEEWEIVAALHAHDIVTVNLYEKTLDVFKNPHDYSILDLERNIMETERAINSVSLSLYTTLIFTSMNKEANLKTMMDVYKKTDFAKAMSKAQTGFYGRYFISGWKTDAFSYLRTIDAAREKLLDKELLKKFSGGKFESTRKFKGKIIEDYPETIERINSGEALNTDAVALGTVLNDSLLPHRAKIGRKILEDLVVKAEKTEPVAKRTEINK